jgi:hypothetical protein
MATISGQAIRLATLQHPTSTESWRQLALSAGGSAPLETFDYPGAYAQRFDGIEKGGSQSSTHRSHARVIWIKLTSKPGFPAGGVCLHGLPACGSPACIVIVQSYDALFHALKAARQVSIVVDL